MRPLRCLVLLLFTIGWWATLMGSPSWAIADQKLEDQVLQILRDHPEVIIESVQNYQNQQQAEQRQAQQAAVQELQRQPQALIGDSPTQGAAVPTNLLVEFSDFQCPFCARAAAEVNEFVEQQGNSVTFVYKHFPLVSIHDQARPAAQAAWAAQQQDSFWDFHDALFADQSHLGEERYVEIAKKLNLDLKKFNHDRSSKAAQQAIEKDLELGNRIGVSGTPFFILNGNILELPFDKDAMADSLKKPK